MGTSMISIAMPPRVENWGKRNSNRLKYLNSKVPNIPLSGTDGLV